MGNIKRREKNGKRKKQKEKKRGEKGGKEKRLVGQKIFNFKQF